MGTTIERIVRRTTTPIMWVVFLHVSASEEYIQQQTGQPGRPEDCGGSDCQFPVQYGKVPFRGDCESRPDVDGGHKEMDAAEEMEQVIWVWVTERYGPLFMAIMPEDDDPEAYVFDVSLGIHDTNDYCTGTVTFDDACRIFVTEEFECTPVD